MRLNHLSSTLPLSTNLKKLPKLTEKQKIVLSIAAVTFSALALYLLKAKFFKQTTVSPSIISKTPSNAEKPSSNTSNNEPQPPASSQPDDPLRSFSEFIQEKLTALLQTEEREEVIISPFFKALEKISSHPDWQGPTKKYLLNLAENSESLIVKANAYKILFLTATPEEKSTIFSYFQRLDYLKKDVRICSDTLAQLFLVFIEDPAYREEGLCLCVKHLENLPMPARNGGSFSAIVGDKTITSINCSTIGPRTLENLIKKAAIYASKDQIERLSFCLLRGIYYTNLGHILAPIYKKCPLETQNTVIDDCIKTINKKPITQLTNARSIENLIQLYKDTEDQKVFDKIHDLFFKSNKRKNRPLSNSTIYSLSLIPSLCQSFKKEVFILNAPYGFVNNSRENIDYFICLLHMGQLTDEEKKQLCHTLSANQRHTPSFIRLLEQILALSIDDFNDLLKHTSYEKGLFPLLLLAHQDPSYKNQAEALQKLFINKGISDVPAFLLAMALYSDDPEQQQEYQNKFMQCSDGYTFIPVLSNPPEWLFEAFLKKHQESSFSTHFFLNCLKKFYTPERKEAIEKACLEELQEKFNAWDQYSHHLSLITDLFFQT